MEWMAVKKYQHSQRGYTYSTESSWSAEHFARLRVVIENLFSLLKEFLIQLGRHHIYNLMLYIISFTLYRTDDMYYRVLCAKSLINLDLES